MPNCCNGGSCSCRIVAGSGIDVAGSGTSGDPFVLTADTSLQVADNAVFDLTLAGDGSIATPWVMSTAYAPSATLNDIPDVDANGPGNGQVLGYDTATGKWKAITAPTASPGAVQHGPSLTGDGSAGAPLTVVGDSARLVGVSASGVGLTDTGMNQTVRRFASTTARDAAVPAPTLNTLSMLDTAPGSIDYWTGAAWEPRSDRNPHRHSGSTFLQLSGPYTTGMAIVTLTYRMSTTTAADGSLVVVPASVLTGYSGVLSVNVQEILLGPSGTLPTGFRVIPYPATTQVGGYTYRLDSGTALGSAAVNALVTLVLY